MNKTAIKNFSIWARNKLIDDIRYRAGLLGITEDGIQPPLPQSTKDMEFYDIGTASDRLQVHRGGSRLHLVQPSHRHSLYGGQRLPSLPHPCAVL